MLRLGGFFLFDAMFTIVPLFMIAIIVLRVRSVFNRGRENSRAPQLTVEAQVVAKRTQGTYSHNDGMDGGTTHYYVTFEFLSGDRMELEVEGYDYGLMVEGDIGKVTFKGTKFINYVRDNVIEA